MTYITYITYMTYHNIIMTILYYNIVLNNVNTGILHLELQKLVKY